MGSNDVYKCAGRRITLKVNNEINHYHILSLTFRILKPRHLKSINNFNNKKNIYITFYFNIICKKQFLSHF